MSRLRGAGGCAIAAALFILAEPAIAQCPGAGDCCIANGSPGCDDLPCCVEVCLNDPFCCDVQWDSLCASLGNSLCAVCGAGCPGTGNCCSANPSPGCDDFFCCSTVCTGNPFCCDTAWDALCAQQANVLCALCTPPPVCPGGGDCCSPNPTPACDDARCCVAVCAVDSFCCVSLWDNICAATAADLCSACAPPPVFGDLTGDGTVGTVDFLILLKQWGPCDLCADCPVDLDGDCEVGITDLLLLLANWG